MRRRDLLAGGLAAISARALWAADENRMHRLAVCTATNSSFSKSNIWTLFFNRLQNMGFVEGKNVIIARYTTEGQVARYAEIARNIVQAKPDVIALDFDHRFILEVAKATSTIPIVATFGDPVAAGIAKNMGRPERNVTGVSLDAGVEMQGKHLELLRQAVPSASRFGYLSGRAEWEGAWGQAGRDASERLNVSLTGIVVEQTAGEAEYRQAFEALTQRSVQALLVPGLPPNFENRNLIVELALRERMPTISWWPDLVEKGHAFLSYAPDYPFYFDLWAREVVQALNGTAPADIPIQQATKLLLEINLNTAQAIGLHVPATFISLADKVIE